MRKIQRIDGEVIITFSEAFNKLKSCVEKLNELTIGENKKYTKGSCRRDEDVLCQNKTFLLRIQARENVTRMKKTTWLWLS